MKRIVGIIFLLSVFFGGIFTISVSAESTVKSVELKIDNNNISLSYIEQNGKIYFHLRTITNNLGISTKWSSKDKTIYQSYPDGREVKIKTNSKQIIKESLTSYLDMLLYQGSTYVEKDSLRQITERQNVWNHDEQSLILFHDLYQQQGTSIISQLPYQGFHVKNHTITFELEGLPKASWKMNGELKDFRLIHKKKQSNIEEYQYAGFYKIGNSTSHLLFTERILPNGDYIIYVKGYSTDYRQQLWQEVLPSEKVYGSNAYIYLNKDQFNTLLSVKEFNNQGYINLRAGQSIDQWYIFSKESLEIKNSLAKRAWDLSKDYHNTNTWVTAKGTYRKTPTPYQNKVDKRNYNINLQASVPMLMLETLQIEQNRLFEDFIHNAKFTLISMQDADGFWRMGINAAYLNRAYDLGPDFIDTRMSVDASLFLLRYGLMYNDKEAIAKSKEFKNYFSMLKKKGLIYKDNKAVLYPDYYSERQRGKTLVSLNHALYEMNYLYTLYNWTDDIEAKGIADEMLAFIQSSSDQWLTNDGDLYYGLSPEGKYYGKDYVNVTYLDLFTAQSILRFMSMDDSKINILFEKKGEYLKTIKSPFYESNFQFDYLFNTFDQNISNKGELFMSYPLQVKRVEGLDTAYSAYGAYHFIKGIESISFKGRTIALNPTKKYIVVLTRDKIYLLDDPVAKKVNFN